MRKAAIYIREFQAARQRTVRRVTRKPPHNYSVKPPPKPKPTPPPNPGALFLVQSGREIKMALPAAAYSNLALVDLNATPALKPSSRARQAAAQRERDRELRVKRLIDRANAVL